MLLPNRLKAKTIADDPESQRRKAQERAIESGEYVLPFGKHKGWKISEVPTEYLKWMIDNFDDPTKPAFVAAETEYAKRDGKPIQFR